MKLLQLALYLKAHSNYFDCMTSNKTVCKDFIVKDPFSTTPTKTTA